MLETQNTRMDSSDGHADVQLTSERLIVCRLTGAITDNVVKGSMHRTQELTELVRSRGRVPQLLIDVTGMTSQTRGARNRAKELRNFGLEKIAVYGTNRFITAVGEYIASAARMIGYTKFFRTEAAARSWLNDGRALKSEQPQRYVDAQLLILILAEIAVGALVGWLLNNDTLVAVLPNLRPMNPMTAVSLVLMAYALTLLIQLKPGNKLRTAGVSLVAGWFVIYGFFILLRYMSVADVGIDRWLFSEKIGFLGGYPAHASPGSGLNFVLLGCLLGLALTPLKKAWQQYPFRILMGLSLATIASVLVGYGFGVDRLYQITRFSPMPLNTAIGLLLANAVIIIAVYRPDLFPVASKFLRIYWQGVIVFVVIAFLTGFAWQQTKQAIAQSQESHIQEAFEKTTAAINGRVSSYIDALHGFKAFFESNTFVSPAEFENYFNRSGLQKNYPGFSAVSFVKYLPIGEKQAFETQMRQQAAESPLYQNFTIKPVGATQRLYVVTYAMPRLSDGSYGMDLSGSAERVKTFETARDSGNPAASNTLTLEPTDSTGRSEGFILGTPIYAVGAEAPNTISQRQARFSGVVNAVFRNEVLFADIFKSLPLQEGTSFTITDTDRGKVLYQSDELVIAGSKPRVSRTIQVAGQNWNIALRTDPAFANDNATRHTPVLVLIGGLTLALSAGLLVVSQSRRREEALVLASEMTEDLNNERDEAIATKQKDEIILAGIAEGLVIFDTTGKILRINLAAQKLLGYTEAELVGQSFENALVTFDDKDNVIVGNSQAIISRLKQGNTLEQQTRYKRKNGTVFSAHLVISPMVIEGEVQGGIEVFRDVTKELELDRAKSEFVSLASHQLRTPLSAVNWYAEMLLNGDAGPINETQREYLNEIYEGNQRMVELVDSLLNISRLELGKLRNEPSPTSILEITDSLQKELAPGITSKNINLKRDVPAEMPIIIVDPRLLRMILQNLLSNAVKYTPANGSVTLTMRAVLPEHLTKVHIAPGQKCLFLSVTDTGYGIPKEQQDKIFGKLFRADNVRKLDVEGTGLGLYIIKEVVKMLGGTIWFSSTESVGTTFYVVLPFSTVPTPDTAIMNKTTGVTQP